MPKPQDQVDAGVQHPKRLTDLDRTEIVTRLAMYDTPSAIAEFFAERNIKITRQGIGKYDPNRNACLSSKWTTLFDDTRRRWITELVKEPIAHRAYRLRKLQQLFEDALEQKAIALASSLLEQAAKEIGGQYTNKSVIDQRATSTFEDLTPDRQRNLVKAKLHEAIEEAIARSADKDDGTKH